MVAAPSELKVYVRLSQKANEKTREQTEDF